MPAPRVTRLTPDPGLRPGSVVITIPGSTEKTSRRSAKNPQVGLSAYVVPDAKTNIKSLLSVSIERNDRLMAATLRGHDQQIVDLEFLPSEPSEPVFVLGSCDTDGVVCLWFLHIPKDALGVDVELRLLKKYSFYSLRRSTTAYYTRIRLAGTPDDGTMVLVRNDGSNCRIVNFSCHVDQPPDPLDTPALAPSDPVPQLPPPEDSTPQEPDTTNPATDLTGATADTPVVVAETPLKEESRGDNSALAKGLAAGAVTGAATGAAVTSFMNDDDDAGEKVIGEGLVGDHDTLPIGETIDSVEPQAIVEPTTLVEDAEEGEDEFVDAVEERVISPVEEHEQAFDERMVPEQVYEELVEEEELLEEEEVYEEHVEDEHVYGEHEQGYVEHEQAYEPQHEPVYEPLQAPAYEQQHEQQHEQVYAEGLRETSHTAPETAHVAGLNSYDAHEEVIEEEVIDEEAEFEDELEELEEHGEEEYEEYVEPEVERVYGEGLGNGHGPNHAPRY